MVSLRLLPDLGLRVHIALFFSDRLDHNRCPPMRTKGTPGGVLTVHAVSDRSIGKGSLVEVLLFDPWKGARSDIQEEYDLAALGEVENIRGPFSNPPRWMVSYKGKVSAKYSDQIQARVVQCPDGSSKRASTSLAPLL
jgi:hypothetical protein